MNKYNFTDNSNFKNGTYKYRLKQIDLNGSYSYSDEIEVVFAVRSYSLEQNYPNPFNPSTTIKFALPFTSKVKLEIFNILGERVKTLIDELKEAGYHEVIWNSNGLASGVYFYTIFAKNDNGNKDFRSVKKMLLLK